MASLRPEPSMKTTSSAVESWAIKISFGFMLLGIFRLVVYDLVDPETAGAATGAEDSKKEADTAAATEAPAPSPSPTMDRRRSSTPAMERRSPMRISRERSLSPPSAESEPLADPEEASEKSSISNARVMAERANRQPMISLGGSGERIRNLIRPIQAIGQPSEPSEERGGPAPEAPQDQPGSSPSQVPEAPEPGPPPEGAQGEH
jgi:hypothetical protein